MRKTKDVEIFGKKVKLSERSAGDRFSLAEMAAIEGAGLIERLPEMKLGDLSMTNEEKIEVLTKHKMANLSRAQAELKYYVYSLAIWQSLGYGLSISQIARIHNLPFDFVANFIQELRQKDLIC